LSPTRRKVPLWTPAPASTFRGSSLRAGPGSRAALYTPLRLHSTLDGCFGRPVEAANRFERLAHGGGFVTAMHHTVLALVVAALAAVLLPLRVFHQFPERLRVTFLQQITRFLPAENVVRGVAPGRALKVVLALEEYQEQRREVELPTLLGLFQNV